MQNIIKFIVVSLFIFVLGIFYLALKENPNYDTEHLIGNKLNNVKLENLNGGKFYTDDDFKKNSYTLINFWASWCAPCRVEHPFLMKLSTEQNLTIIGVNFKDKKNNALKFLNDLGDPYDYLAGDALGKNSVNFGVYGIPESILVDKGLIIIRKFVGPLSNNDLIDIQKIINSL